MITDNTLVVFIIIGAVALLAIVQITLAIRQDRLVSAAGPIEELAVYEKRLEEKQHLMDDLEEELAKRREAMAVVADIGAEVDGLRRQKEELLAEWNAMGDKREEVQAMRREIEDVVIERQSLEAEIAPLQAEYLSVKERLEKAEELVGRIDALTTEHAEISGKVEAMRGQLRRLEEAEARVARLEDRGNELEANCARLEGRIASQNDELAELTARVAKARDALAEVQSEHSRTEAQSAAENLELRRQQGELDALGETRSALEARLAYLKGEIAKAEGRTPDGESVESDKLRELREEPPVIRAMVEWPLADRENETDALKRVERRFRAKGLHYPARTLYAFHTAMKVNETTQMAVLAGISGTGKSQLPRQYAAGMGIGFLQVPVQPRWDSPQDLMGFYNYIEGKFRPTDMARALWALDEINNDDAIQDRMMMILLDEMNLARVEYYFSDFLSRLESRPKPEEVGDANERKDAEIELEIPNMQYPPRIFPGYNLLFAGTMNEDESTQSLSDKVVDRANVLRFAAPRAINTARPDGEVSEVRALSQERWQGWVRPVSAVEGEARVRNSVETMVEIMKDLKCPIGHRLGRAIMAYVANYPNAEGTRPTEDALADQVEMRLLPKLRGVDFEIAAPHFSRLRTWVEQGLGDEKLAQAIADSVQSSEETGQFVWSGVTR
ncbi:chromosome segregation ATPase-like protein [Rhodovulum sulfidophilum]|uniref:chromosome segregation ATPase-like protein n=1 Tax=Rhodovulum sulfidophilum TaxID=35806 RepID=UPI0019113CD6|nr:chromosome segregation ATPase-like protein [Rhodovulum sulfidophilum]MBK5924618.1 chromosome segregation ATPase-like protein [Rhodovulum sulfidophilum]